jgi:hypothetical protein
MSRRASDSAGSVLSFTFLDVLMCTMGSLLLLLVVFGVIVKKSTRERRAGEQAQISLAALSQPTAPASAGAVAPAAEPEDDAADLAQQLEELRRQQSEVEQLRADAAERRRVEEERIRHLEDHERRLEHALGQLYVTLQALEAAEQETVVDQQQAEADVKRLQDLIRDTEAELTEMRARGGPPKSFAIVPYKGANGTFRRPIFVECTAEAVTIQPEGIRLTVEDFDGPLRSGNPLAAAIRAAHEELNARAAAAGQAEMPDPYPLLIVRPDGAGAYVAALDAIRSWDADYGYEFVDADWKLKYPEPDPRLAQLMSHAVDQARERQALLARVAPGRYAPRLTGGGRGGVGGVGDGSNEGGGFGSLAGHGGGGDRIGAHGGEGAFGEGAGGGRNPLRGGGRYGQSAEGNFSDEFATTPNAGAAGGSGGGAGGGQSEAGVDSTTGADGVPGGTALVGTTRGGQPGSPPGAASGVQQGQPGGAATEAAGDNATNGARGSMAAAGGASGGTATGAAGGASGSSGTGGSPSSGGGAAPGNVGGQYTVQTGARRGSAADTRGANWANEEAARRASPVTRPIRVLVRVNRLALHETDAAASDAAVVSFEQPVDRVMDQLAGAIRTHMADWGIAGDGMYWRPTLVVTVAPGAERQAARLAELLENSGIDVRLPAAVAQHPTGGGHETR